MSAGTITLTNGSAIVGGSGTSFATELAAGDFIVSTVGGVDYTLPVKTVDGNTQVTLVSNFTGPTQSGAAWSAVPRATQNQLTAELVAQTTEALRGLNYDKQNWQAVFSVSGDITVKLPDGSSFSGPSWKYITDLLKNRDAVNTSWSVINGDTALPSNNTSIKGGQVLSVYQVSGVDEMVGGIQAVGTVGGAYTTRISISNKNKNAGIPVNFDFSDTGDANIPGTITAGGANITGASTIRDCRYLLMNGSIEGKSNINVFNMSDEGPGSTAVRGSQFILHLGADQAASSRVELYPIDYTGRYFAAKLYALKDTGGYSWEFKQEDGTLHGSGAYVVDSDIRVKSDLEKVKNPLQAVLNWRGVTYKRKDVDKREVGLIAQDVEPWSPEAISVGTHTSFDQKTTIDDFKSLNYSGLSAAFHTEAIKELLLLLDLALTDPEEAKVRIAGLKKEIK
ncbi:tail fiber domain-containing protein [Enterobacter roggenkampii]|uniref:tail fiber domain-containing protein n=1 Tax=Enterobacter roggenkampii TaxID=1812935 RepID=UPI0015E9B78F|nr:tail fiber domain-containing protein [Enterobacter roggenkampii]QLS02116.1 tail fiber domain-containing protein [Enterobacter roggenkampii]